MAKKSKAVRTREEAYYKNMRTMPQHADGLKRFIFTEHKKVKDNYGVLTALEKCVEPLTQIVDSSDNFFDEELDDLRKAIIFKLGKKKCKKLVNILTHVV